MASLIQSSTATCLIMASFLGRNVVPLTASLAVMLGLVLGANVGSGVLAGRKR